MNGTALSRIRVFRPQPAKLQDEQVSALFRSVAPGVVAAACAAIVLGGLLIAIGRLHWSVAGLWVVAVCACAAGHLQLRRDYRASPPVLRQAPGWPRRFALIAFAEGLFWGWISVVAIGSNPLGVEMLVLVVTLAIAAGSVPCFGPHLPSFLALFLPATLPFLIWSLLAGGTMHEALALLMLIYVGGMGSMGLAYNRNFNALVRLRMEKEDLAAALQVQKDIAERASYEKSQFLASASHDLRQPVHALGLFVGALRGIQISDEGLKLIDQLDHALLGLDNLFHTVLDISRLDAGVLEVRHEDFAVQSILDRVTADLAPAAASKGIGLRQHPCSLGVRSDPVLVERILRNLVENAIRYTESGRVVIGCRRAGAWLHLEVWDTGCGIAQAEQDRIFQEFYQVRDAGAHMRGGLGLGLAIVRRLAKALDAPLTLRSTLGLGSVFRLSLPRAALWEETAIAASSLPSAVLPRAFIVIIDDDDVVRGALGRLLTHWGHQVVAAASGQLAISALADCPERPDLIITDYRIDPDENGLDAVQRFNAEYNAEIPAIIMMGEMQAAELKEVHGSGYLVLHKPVPDRQLRAAIGNLLRP
ncbi:ATP-binding response regulator [Acidisoma silvae]|uniref:histidine kinase n=1 Tax=Acidisoma silvae TaxID=2802396 RepID=A0A963YSX1_9PROT|nr:hybrid sensor histidine kinase/response regulator [Acidisoma silvae]MCB8876411.1 response regulator [Acidisoma silvae]